MASKSLTRRKVLQAIGVGISAGASAPLLVSIESAGHMHSALREERTRAGAYTPKFFRPDEYELLKALCGAIIPADESSGGALEAGAPEFIDLLTSENEDYQRRLGGGLIWLNATCLKRYNAVYMECSPAEQKGILDLIAYRANRDNDSGLSPGIDFFAFLRELTVDAFATSEIGIKYLGYIGNTFLSEFPGCPPIPDD
ncbi:MAG TPA: gluconate 2-dehydrogenase subunit 3 family protein [Terriglobia bacterium]|nr:gluconate 2-dehydrogenase subunit 3 family protein [Terriglobia bacterium]